MSVQQLELTVEATQERFVDFLTSGAITPTEQAIIRFAHGTKDSVSRERAAKRLIVLIEDQDVSLFADLVELAPKKDAMVSLVEDMLFSAVDKAVHDTQPISIPVIGGSQD